jgi:hypothetical protein
MRYFLDCEFNQNVDPVQLISIGIVGEDGREFYATSCAFDPTLCDVWLGANVLPVRHKEGIVTDKTRYLRDATLPVIKSYLEDFFKDDEKAEFWGYYADYDWYLFTRFWGFMDMPKNFPMLCLDVKQWAMHLGVRNLPEVFQPEHHALVDARWTKRAFEYLADGK